MLETVRFRLNDASDAPEVLVEVVGDDEADVEDADFDAVDADRLERVGLAGALARTAHKSLNRSMATIPQVANTVLDKIDDVDERPDLVEFTMGFKLTASGDLKLAAGSGEAHVTVRMEWSRRDKG